MNALVDGRISLADVRAQAGRVQAVVSQVRGAMLAPDARKKTPTYSTGDVMSLCGLSKSAMEVALRRGVLPVGTIGPGSRRAFTLEELQAWVRHYRAEQLRPAGAKAVCVAVANFKGGATKTTTAVTLAQGLSLRGHRVLVVDTDPQGSLTTLFGLLPDSEVSREQTVLPLIEGEQSSLRSAVQPTYWPGIDLVPAAPVLFSAEFELSNRAAMEPGFEVWSVLEQGLRDLRQDYDVVIMDTPPALSYVTLNVLMAADGVLMPLPPSTLDFASSAQFWTLFSDIAARLTGRAQDKKFDFISVLPAKVESVDAASVAVRQWMAAAYAEHLMPVEIPKSAAVGGASANFGTVYDAADSSRTLKRATDAADKLCDMLALQCVEAWKRQLARAPAESVPVGSAA